MLLKNLKKQQEEEQEEEEERQRGLKEQRRAFEESRQRCDTTTSVGSVVEERKGDVDCEDDDLSIEYEKNKEEEEVEINRSIYDAGTGVVNNPLYSSQINLSSCDDGGEDARDKIHSTYTYSGTSGASDTSAPASDASVGNQDAVGKVNPVPKPPRTTYGDGRPSTESQSFQSDDETKNFTEVSDSLRQQSYSGSRKDERVSDTTGLEEGPADVPSVQDDEGSRFDACDFGEEVEDNDEEEIVEARNRLYSNPEDSEEGEGFYQVNSDSDEDTYRVGSESSLRKLGKTTGEGELGDVDFLRGDQCSDSSLTEEEKEEVQKESFEGNYSDLLNKMKLERALSIDSEASGHSPDFGSPAASRKKILNSPIDTAPSVSPTALDDGEIGSDREENGKYGSEREHGYIQSSDEDQKMMQYALTEALSDSEEKFEQLYNRLRKDSIEYLEAEDYGENERSEQTTNENVTSVLEGEVKKSSASYEDIVKENGHIAEEDMLDSPSGSQSEMTTKKRVNSIIKKKDKGMPTSGTGTIKKVQFNLEVDTIESPATSESDSLVTAKDLAKKNEDSTVASAKEKLESLTDKKTKEVSFKSAGGHDLGEEATVTARTSPTAEKKTIDSTAESQTKKETSGTKSPPSPSKKKSTDSSVTSPSKKKVTGPSNSHTPTKKKGIFSSIFSSSSTKKSDTSSAKDDTSSKKKSSDSPTQAVRRQQTVDLSAPSIISGE